MRGTLALLLPMLLVLGAIAWGATEIVQHTSRRWFDRDTRLRAEMAGAGAPGGRAARADRGPHHLPAGGAPARHRDPDRGRGWAARLRGPRARHELGRRPRDRDPPLPGAPVRSRRRRRRE